MCVHPSTTSGGFRIGGEPGESEIAEDAFLYAIFTPVFVSLFLTSFWERRQSRWHAYTMRCSRLDSQNRVIFRCTFFKIYTRQSRISSVGWNSMRSCQTYADIETLRKTTGALQ